MSCGVIKLTRYASTPGGQTHAVLDPRGQARAAAAQAIAHAMRSLALLFVLGLALDAAAIKCSQGFTCDKAWRPVRAAARALARERARALMSSLDRARSAMHRDAR